MFISKIVLWTDVRFKIMLDIFAQEMIRTYRDFSDGFDNGALFLLGLVLSLYCNFNCGLRSFSENYTTLTFITIY